jgi:hypothetical protein
MCKKILSIGAVILSVPITLLWAVDLSGNWIVRIPNETFFRFETEGSKPAEIPIKSVETVFSFTVSGSKLTGKVTTPYGETEISEGKIDGDEISFVVKLNVDGKQGLWRFNGRTGGIVYGEEIRFTCEVTGASEKPHAFDFTAKKEFPLGDYDLFMRGKSIR